MSYRAFALTDATTKLDLFPDQLEAAFWRYVLVTGDCWTWTGSRESQGYGRLTRTVRGRQRILKAHRLAHVLFNGTIPSGRELDHTCRNRACVNPAHLEVVSHQENMRRSPIGKPAQERAKTHCARGHRYDKENTLVDARGWRKCRLCRREDTRRWREKAKLRAA
jgi:HNH endonuclease